MKFFNAKTIQASELPTQFAGHTMASASGGQNVLTTTVSNKLPVKSYANVIRPKKDQAIIIDAVDGLTNDDYIDGLELLNAVSNIVSISKISGGRICVFLSNKTWVDKLSGQTIRINGNELPIRPLIEKNKRLVLSNVQTHISNELLAEGLSIHGILPVSPIHNIRASLSKPGRSHIQSHRRQVYIKEDTVVPIPESFKIMFEDTTYWIYLSTDSTLFFTCNQNGHMAKLCPLNRLMQPDANSPSQQYFCSSKKREKNNQQGKEQPTTQFIDTASPFPPENSNPAHQVTSLTSPTPLSLSAKTNDKITFHKFSL